MTVVKTGSTYISACGGASNAISNHYATFLGSGNSVAPLPTLPHNNGSRNPRWQSSKPEVPICQLVEELETRFKIILHCRYYRWIAEPRKLWLSRWNCVAIMFTIGDMSTSGLAAAILDLSLPVRSDSIVGITVGLLDLKNIGSAVVVALQ